MTIRTGIEISHDVNNVMDDKFCDVIWYLGMDVDARIQFYNKHVFDITSVYGDEMPGWLKKLYDSQFKPYSLFIIDFCFGNMSEDFISKIKKETKK